MDIDIDSEDKLALNISDRYFSRWVCQQLLGWRAWAATCRLPASSLQGGNQYKAAQTDLQFEFPMFSTTGMMWMLLRWASTLKADASREAATNLKRLNDNSIASNNALPCYSGASRSVAYRLLALHASERCCNH